MISTGTHVPRDIEPGDVHVNIVAHRAAKRSAETFVARYADVVGEQSHWTGSTLRPTFVEWSVERCATGGFDIVQTTTFI
jgi:aminoglycoside N3'-acetyltransferase